MGVVWPGGGPVQAVSKTPSVPARSDTEPARRLFTRVARSGSSGLKIRADSPADHRSGDCHHEDERPDQRVRVARRGALKVTAVAGWRNTVAQRPHRHPAAMNHE